VSQFGDPLQMAIVVAILASSSSYTSKISHLEGEEVFGSIKQKQNLPLGSEGNSHRHNCVNFFNLKVEFILCHFAPNGNVRQSNRSQEGFLILTHTGEEVLECLCDNCRNPSLGLATKARVYKGASQEESPGSHLMLSGVQKSVRE